MKFPTIEKKARMTSKDSYVQVTISRREKALKEPRGDVLWRCYCGPMQLMGMV